ncbi:hypothetical protein Pan161_04900 [Gimesia algae]|uniref:Uncharacterized protein n=1 Tax=Gimesia algae TaxID=2527971 RepID=A0A517V785_9PLAN|nr:hypothetical protein Pan161_04900 [Gimesia algae]
MQSTPDTPTRNPLKQCSILTFSLLGLYALLCVPAYMFVGLRAVEGLTYAVVLCLVPGMLVFLISGFLYRDAAPVTVMGVSTLVRLMIVGIGTLVIIKLRTDFGSAEFLNFLIWLLICYFASLLVETLLIIR